MRAPRQYKLRRKHVAFRSTFEDGERDDATSDSSVVSEDKNALSGRKAQSAGQMASTTYIGSVEAHQVLAERKKIWSEEGSMDQLHAPRKSLHETRLDSTHCSQGQQVGAGILVVK